MFIPNIIIIFNVLFINCIIESASDENLNNLQRFLPPSEEDISKTNQRFQQIMQGEANPVDTGFIAPKSKVDVKTELGKLNSTYAYQPNWADPKRKLGAVSAVTFDKAGNVVIFHRADRIWSTQTFNMKNVFMERQLGTIPENTIIAYNRKSGEIVYEWGKNLFFLPHGLTIDGNDNVWVTDVALHQVMKFPPKGGDGKPLLTLGSAFTPGPGDKTFCKPTSVAVLANGDFFVADGYCNARIIKYNEKGQKLLEWGHNLYRAAAYEIAPQNFFAIPHALTLVRDKDLLCAADRENGRIQCFFTNNGTFHSQYYNPIIGDRLFSMDYSPVDGGQFFIVNGPSVGLGLQSVHYNEVHGFVMDQKTKQVRSKFGPNDLTFSNPHDIAVTMDGSEVYVAELNPTRIHKFLSKRMVSQPAPSKPTATLIDAADLTTGMIRGKAKPGSTMLLVGSLIAIFGFLTIGMAMLISRRRKRGCLPFGARNRRHAWDFPTKPDGFKLGNLLDRKRGFEKLDQNASDEEPDASTNMLASAQFA